MWMFWRIFCPSLPLSAYLCVCEGRGISLLSENAFNYCFSRFQGLFGALTCSKTLETLHTGQNPRPSGPGLRWYPGVAGGSTAPPGTGSVNLVHKSNTLACNNMKLGTHIDLIGSYILHALTFYPSPTGSRLFRVVWKTHAMEFEILLLEHSNTRHETRCA